MWPGGQPGAGESGGRRGASAATASISTSWSGDTRRETSIIVEAGYGGLKYLARAAETSPAAADVAEVHGQLDDVGHGPAGLGEDVLDGVEDPDGLGPGVPGGERLAVRVSWPSAR